MKLHVDAALSWSGRRRLAELEHADAELVEVVCRSGRAGLVSLDLGGLRRFHRQAM